MPSCYGCCEIYMMQLLWVRKGRLSGIQIENDKEKADKKGKGRYSSSWEPRLRATGRHLPYGITQCYLPPDDTSARAPPNRKPCRLVLDLPNPEGWKAELT